MAIARQYTLISAEGMEAQLEGALADLAATLAKAEGLRDVTILRSREHSQHYSFLERWAGESSRKASARLLDEALMARIQGALASSPKVETFDIFD